MKIRLSSIQLEVLKRHTGPFVFCFSIIMFLLLLQFLVLHLDKIVGKDIPFTVIVELISVNLAYMLVMAIPMSILVACLMAFGNFAENNELAALKAAGISPISVIRPVLFVAVIISVFLTWFSNDVLPEANYRARALFMDIRMKKPGFDLKPNVFYEGIDGYSFLVRRVEAGGDSLYNVTLFQQPSSQRDQAVIKADYGILRSEEKDQSLTLFLYNGTIMRDLPSNVTGKMRVEESEFSSYRIRFDIGDLNFSRSDPAQHRRDDRTMSSQAMLATVDSLNREINRETDQFISNSAHHQIKSIRSRFNESLISEQSGSNQEIASQTKKSARNIPENVPDKLNATSQQPYPEMEAASEVLLRRPGLTGTIDRSGATERIHSSYTTLNNLENSQQQIFVTDNTISSVRETSSASVNMENNIRWRMERAAQYMVEVHKKFSIPLGCIIFVMLGAPLGMLTKKGNIGFNAVISTVLFTYYWMGIIQGEKLADRMIISPFTGMWFVNLTLLAVGIILLIKVQTEFHIGDIKRDRT
jgi:lipopolysaccharide export system permease protein